MSKYITIQLNETETVTVRSELETASEPPLTDHELVINHLYKKLNSTQNCLIVYDCREELSVGSSLCVTALPFTNEELKNKFVKNWNNNNSELEKSKDEENKYFCGDWVYWLEFENGFINFK